MPIRRYRLTSAALAVLTIGGSAALVLVHDDANQALAAEEASALARGAEIYAEACASCHGADLEGQPNWRSPGPEGRLPAPPHDETGHTWHHSDRVLFEITKYGTAAVVGGNYDSDMPGFGDTYSDEDIRATLEWIKSRWPERERAYQAQITAKDRDRD